MRFQRRSGCCTSTWTKAPVSFSSSQGAVVSHARRRTITFFHRADWPGCNATFWTIPLRLLRIPRTATRWAIGVTPPTPAAFEAPRRPPGSGAFGCSLPLPQEASARAISSVTPARFTLILGSRARNPRSRRGAAFRTQAHRRAYMPPSCPSGSRLASAGICGSAAAPSRADHRSFP